jgi:rhamnulokinase
MIHPGEEYGKLKKEYLPEGIHKDIPVIAVCTHDTGSAVLGANGKGKFAYISSGTWSLIGTELNKPIINQESLTANFTNEIGYHSTIRFLKNTMGMFLCNQVRDDYEKNGVHFSVKDIATLVNEAEDIDTFLAVDDPIFETPGDMLSKVAAYCERTNQAFPSTPGQMLKVIYKSMALTYKKIIAKLEVLADERIHSILVVGGGNQATILNQYTASACGIDVITGPSEATILGNSLAQLLALGDVASVEEGREDLTRSIESKIYRPQELDYWGRQYQTYLLRCMS